MPITAYYKSKVRKRRWGTMCKECHRFMDTGEICMREQLEYNSYGCMMYNELCMKCYKKVLPKALKTQTKEIKENIKRQQKLLKSIKLKL